MLMAIQPTTVNQKAKAEPVKIIAKATSKQSVKALLIAKKPDANDKKSVATTTLKNKENAKANSVTMQKNGVIELAKKVSMNNKIIIEKNKVATTKTLKVSAKMSTINVATIAQTKNTLHKKI